MWKGRQGGIKKIGKGEQKKDTQQDIKRKARELKRHIRGSTTKKKGNVFDKTGKESTKR